MFVFLVHKAPRSGWLWLYSTSIMHPLVSGLDTTFPVDAVVARHRGDFPFQTTLDLQCLHDIAVEPAQRLHKVFLGSVEQLSPLPDLLLCFLLQRKYLLPFRFDPQDMEFLSTTSGLPRGTSEHPILGLQFFCE